jgi:flagellar hook assembly protein FlgD
VADINGNESTRETLFRVSDGFDLIVYGNYPNPFTDKTIISFDVINNNIIDDLKVKIYTISGRLIRSGVLELDETFPDDNILDVGYHELIWDGTDEDGFEVANGVYFATIEAKVKAKTIKRTLKIAKLK